MAAAPPPPPRFEHIPSGAVGSLSANVGALAEMLGLPLDPWQQRFVDHLFAVNGEGEYTAPVAALSVPRQAGKTTMVGLACLADSIQTPGTRTVWTAHRFRVSRESFDLLRDFCLREEMHRFVDPKEIRTGAGSEAIGFRNGSKIMFAARERGSIRGFSNVRRVVLDEAQILSESTMADVAPVTNAAKNPQMVLMGTPPKPTDPGAVFAGIREAVLADKAPSTLYTEYAANLEGLPVPVDTSNKDLWFQANPSLGVRTPLSALERLHTLMASDGDSFMREALGVWLERGTGTVVDMDAFAALTEIPDERPSPVVFVAGLSDDREWGSIGVAGRLKDGRVHLQVMSGPRAEWVQARLPDMASRWTPAAVAVLSSGQSASLEPLVKPLYRRLSTMSKRSEIASAGLFVDAVRDGTVTHDGGRLLEVSLTAAVRHPSQGAWVWGTAGGDSTDITPLKVASAALTLLAEAPNVDPTATRRGSVI